MNKIVEGMKDAVRFAKGEDVGARVTRYEPSHGSDLVRCHRLIAANPLMTDAEIAAKMPSGWTAAGVAATRKAISETKN